MAAPKAHNLAHVPGKLCKAPTNLATDFPHGGTALGLCKDWSWRPNHKTFNIESEAYNTVVETIYTGEAGVFACVAQEFDADFLSSVFLDTVAGATTGRRLVRGRATTDLFRAGTSLATLAVVLYFSPDDPNAHGLLLYRAIPVLAPDGEINYGLDPEIGISCVWQATPDDSGDIYAIGPRSDLTLPS